MDVRAAVAHVDDAVAGDAELTAQLVDHPDLAIAGGHADDRLDLTSHGIVTKLRTDNVVLGHETFERRLDDFLRRGGNDVERAVEHGRQELDVLLEAYAAADLDQVFTADAAELGV